MTYPSYSLIPSLNDLHRMQDDFAERFAPMISLPHLASMSHGELLTLIDKQRMYVHQFWDAVLRAQLSDFNVVADAVQLLRSRNAQHRSGYRIGDVSPKFILHRAEEEFIELQEAPDDPMELADTMSILIHYAVAKGWDLASIRNMMLTKIKERFGDELKEIPEARVPPDRTEERPGQG